MNNLERRRLFTIVHYINFVAICLQFITRIRQKTDKRVNRRYCAEYMGDYPSLHGYIRNRSKMTTPEFKAYLWENYNWWTLNYYKNEDTNFFTFFTRGLMEEISQLEEEWANPAIDLEATLAKIVSFFMRHLVCESPMRTFLILMHILSSKCFYIDRKRIAKKWKDKTNRNFFLDTQIKKNTRIQAFFFQLLTNFVSCNPSLLPEIQNLRENDARIFDSVSVGFKVLTSLFLKKNVPSQSLPSQLQHLICESTCNLWYAVKQDSGLLWYQMINQKHHCIQNMDRKFRVNLIGKSQFLLILIFRMVHQSEFNKLERISGSMCTKLMLIRRFFRRLFPENPKVSRFLSMMSSRPS